MIGPPPRRSTARPSHHAPTWGRLARRTAVAAAAVLLAGSLGTSSSSVGDAYAEPLTQTVVSLTFDDGPQTQWSARDTLRSHGVRATFYVNSALTGDEPGGWRMTWSQLHELAADGHEITGHTLTHDDLTLMTPTEQRQQICDDRANLLARGFAPVSSLAYPYGSYDDSAKTIARECGYASGRTVGGLRSSLCSSCPFAEALPPTDPFATRTPPDIRDTTSLTTMQGYVTQAEQDGGGWVQLVFHHVCDGCGEYATSLAQLSAFLDWLAPRAAAGTVVKTVGEVMGGSYPPPVDTTPPTTTIACNGAACGTGWYASAVTVTLAATDGGGSGLAETRYTTDGSEPMPSSTLYTGPFALSAQASVRFRSWDNTGNAEPAKSQLVRVDATGPTVAITSPADGSTATRRMTVTVGAAASDGASGVARVEFRVDGTRIATSTAPPYQASWKTAKWGRGVHALTAVATDGAGHSTTSAPVRVTLT